jgi:hypothetical protein
MGSDLNSGAVYGGLPFDHFALVSQNLSVLLVLDY